MESILIVFWIILLASNVKKTKSAIDDLMYEAEEESMKMMPKYSLFSSEDESDNSDGLFNYKVHGRKEEKFIKLQYDMILQKDQYTTLFGNDLAMPEQRSRRNAIKDKDGLWPHGTIPYTISDSFSTAARLSILEAIDMWRMWTCLTFVKAKNNEYNKLTFDITDSGCGQSMVGMIQGEQYIYLSRKCSTDMTVVVHNIGHAIGLLHEHMRHDRDEYVTVHKDNIVNTEEARRQLDVMEQDSYQYFSKPYDYLSIMHYGKLFWSKNKTANLVTMSPKNESYLDIIGEVQTISYHDAKLVCQLYDCSARCDSTCSETGFMGAQCQCMCRGPSDTNPIRLCPARDSCTMPTFDYSKYVVLNKRYETVPKKSGHFDHGTVFYIEWNDIDTCGAESSTYRCHYGVWIGDLPECNQGCDLNTNLKKKYNICDYYPTSTESGVADNIEHCDLLDNYEHGDNIILSCKSDITTRSNSQCNNGSWSILMLNCPEERCPNNDLPAIPNSVVTQSDPSDRINYNEASKHSVEIFFRCYAKHEMFDSDTKKYLNAVVVNVKCAFGKWIPKRCALLCVPDSSHCYIYGQSKHYSGFIRETEIGIPCMDWVVFESSHSYVIDSNFPDGSVVNASNYCRNPDDDSKPWCFIKNEQRWKYCNISVCPERSNANDVTTFKMSVSHAPGYFFVTAPNMFRYKTDENVLVSVFDRSNADIKIWLEYDYFKNGEQKTKQFSRKSVLVHNQESPRLETIRVDENDIFDLDFDDAIEKPDKLRLVAFDGHSEKKLDIILSYDSGYLIVHTDKPIYTPIQNVKVRVLALDESMSNALASDETDNKHQVVMDLVSPSGIRMSRSYGNPSNNRDNMPFYTSEFNIPTKTELGTWTIVTTFTGKFETSERTMFEVEEYVLPTLTVTVTTNILYFLETTERFQVIVDAKYVNRKPVAGSVGLTFFLNHEEAQERILDIPRQHLSVEKGVHVFTIITKDIVNSDLRKDRTGRFPIGEYLTIRADVFESATGNEEIGWSTYIIFADKPYKFTYERSKHFFRPGGVYYFKVDVLLPNGDKANNVEIQVDYKQGRVVETEQKTTDNIGQCNIPFSARGSTQTEMIFEVNVAGIIDTFVVKPYKCAKQVQVEVLERENRFWISLNSNMDQRATGLLFVIMSRGKIMQWKYTHSTNDDQFELEKEILTKITPNARVIVFYVDNNVVVADSVKFDVEAVCRGKLKITTNTDVYPGSYGQLTIEGPRDMTVGLNVMDTSLLLLNSKNILRKTKMFKAMTSHDRGCGESSGSTVEEVFKSSGLTLVTDAAIANDRLKRTYVECPKNNRRKRSLDLRSRERRSSLDGESDYNIDLKKLAGSRPRQRNDFRESWLFAYADLKDGEAKVMLHYPDSITQWMVQAIGFSAQDGMCISNPLYVKTDKDLFIQLDLPYQAVRLEYINIKATIFNYGFIGQDDKTINVYLHGQKDMCSVARPGQTSDRVQLRMAPNTAQTVIFPIIPLKGSTPKRQLAITVAAFVDGYLVNDAISKSLYIINEGIQQKKTIHVCLDPGKENNDCVPSMIILNSDYDNPNEKRQTITINMSLPNDAIPDTGTAIAYIKSNIMTEYSTAITPTEVNLQLTFSAEGWDNSGYTETVTKENINVLKIVENLPVETHDNKLVITVTGTGSARMDIDLLYNIPKPDTPCAFKVSDIDIKPAKENIEMFGRECDVCGYCIEPDNPFFDDLVDDQYLKTQSNFGRRRRRQAVGLKEKICMSFSVSLRFVDQSESGMSIVKVNLQTGMHAIESDLEKLLNDGIIDRYELTYNNKDFIVFYLDKIGHDAKEFKFRLIDEFDGNKDTRQGSNVDVYDYYRPERSCQITYGFGDNIGPLEAKCIGKYKAMCKCVQKLCPAKPDLKYFKNPRRYKPTEKLRKRTCNNIVADYSILVQITDTFLKDNLHVNKASATVLKVFNKGAENLAENESEITFTWSQDCIYPEFVKGKTYYVIAKDGPITYDNGRGYTYPLTDKAFVIEKLNSKDRKDKTLRNVYYLMNKYSRDMKNTGCNA